jgi:hypothetical protein
METDKTADGPEAPDAPPAGSPGDADQAADVGYEGVSGGETTPPSGAPDEASKED